MTAFSKAWILCAAQVALVASVGGKLLVDRATLPRVWVRTTGVDPSLIIRGRYISLRVFAEPRGFAAGQIYAAVSLSVEDGQLVASPAGDSSIHINVQDGTLSEPVAFFIPDGAPDPTHRSPGEELWMEVTIPKTGPPRPIRLGIKTGAVLMPLDLQ
jgi:hypothetical protein